MPLVLRGKIAGKHCYSALLLDYLVYFVLLCDVSCCVFSFIFILFDCLLLLGHMATSFH